MLQLVFLHCLLYWKDLLKKLHYTANKKFNAQTFNVNSSEE